MDFLEYFCGQDYTFLIYDKLDISGGFYFSRRYLNLEQIHSSNSEIFDEFIQDYPNPFSNRLPSFQVEFNGSIPIDTENIEEIAKSIFDSISQCGFTYSDKLYSKLKEFLEYKVK